jgi:hypothetical protein
MRVTAGAASLRGSWSGPFPGVGIEDAFSMRRERQLDDDTTFDERIPEREGLTQ